MEDFTKNFNLQDVFAQAQQMKDKVEQMRTDVESKEVEASAGGGMIKVKVSGKGLINSIVIEKEAVDPEDIEMLQDLVKAAVNEAVRQSKDLYKDELNKLTGGIPIPGFS